MSTRNTVAASNRRTELAGLHAPTAVRRTDTVQNRRVGKAAAALATTLKALWYAPAKP